jgi:hypothetical protein
LAFHELGRQQAVLRLLDEAELLDLEPGDRLRLSWAREVVGSATRSGARQLAALAELADQMRQDGDIVLRTRNPHFEFTDPPFRRSLPMTLAFAATASQHATVLTGPRHRIAAEPALTQPGRADDWGMVSVRLQRHPLSATAGLVWSSDLPRQLQQVLFDTADGIPS